MLPSLLFKSSFRINWSIAQLKCFPEPRDLFSSCVIVPVHFPPAFIMLFLYPQKSLLILLIIFIPTFFIFPLYHYNKILKYWFIQPAFIICQVLQKTLGIVWKTSSFLVFIELTIHKNRWANFRKIMWHGLVDLSQAGGGRSSSKVVESLDMHTFILFYFWESGKDREDIRICTKT